MKRSLLALAAAFFAGSVWAQNIYRCGDTYSQRPCSGSQAVATDDARSAAQKAQADAVTARDARMADAMERERLKAEAKPNAVYIPPAKPEPSAPITAKPKIVKAKSKKKEPEFFTAVAPAKPGDKPARKKKSSSAKKTG